MQLTVTTIILGLPEGQRVEHSSLMLPASTLTLRELLAYKTGLTPPERKTNQEPALQGETTNARAEAEPEYMVVVDNRRIVDPDTVITLRPDIRIEFIKILPLVGG